MRTALITTSIHVPTVLALYRRLGPDVAFFVAADEKTPREAYEFCATISNCEIYSPDRQRELGYACSELIGWSCVERRNIALLEAVKWGADAIVTIDDDNASIDPSYFHNFSVLALPTGQYELGPAENPGRGALVHEFSGLKASSPTGWFDPGCLLVPQTKHRGFPIGIRSEPVFTPVTDARIGVAQGLCLGDPDIDAVTRIALNPIIHSVSELGHAGIVADPRCWTVWNTQNTAFIRELAPAMFQMPGVGRYSDIYASLITQRVMRERGLYVHFGQPFIWQQRNKHNLIGDLRQEIDGMEKIERFCKYLDSVMLPFDKDAPITALVRYLYHGFDSLPNSYDLLPKQSVAAAMSFLDDIEHLL